MKTPTPLPRTAGHGGVAELKHMAGSMAATAAVQGTQQQLPARLTHARLAPRPLMMALLAGAAMLAAAAAAAAAVAPWPALSQYRVCRVVPALPGLKDDASGAAYDPSCGGSWWVVAGEPLALAQYSLGLTGPALRQVGLPKSVHDPEAVVWLGASPAVPGSTATITHLAVMEENEVRVRNISLPTLAPLAPGGACAPAPNSDDLEVSSAKSSLVVRELARRPNKGLEGLAYDPRSGDYLAAQEEFPARVLRVKPNGTYQELFLAPPGMGDLSDLYYIADAAAVHGEGSMYLLSQESRRIMLVSAAGAVLQRLTLSRALPRPEGLAFSPGGQLMLVVSEPHAAALFAAPGVPCP